MDYRKMYRRAGVSKTGAVNRPSTGYCLVCKKKDKLQIIHSVQREKGMTVSYSDLIVKCFYIQFLDRHLGKDNMVCVKCIENIKFCANFRKQVETAHKELYDIKPEVFQTIPLTKPSNNSLVYNITRNVSDNKGLIKVKEELSSDDEPIIKLKTKCQPKKISNNNDNDNDDAFTYDNDAANDSSSESDWSVKTHELDRATGHRKLIKMIRQQQSFIIPQLDQSESRCPMCNKFYPDFYLLKKHYLEHFPSFLCDFCGLAFTRKVFFQKHYFSHSVKKFPCDLCDKKYSTLEAMQRHRQINHFNYLPFVCYHCNMRFKYGLLKKKHMLSVHGVKSRTYKCPHCEDEFFARHMMENHLKKKHLKLKEHQCFACSTAFYNERDLKKHYMVKHEGIKSHKCETCNKTFSYGRGLRTHRKIHLNQRDQVCQMCGAAFIQHTSLKYHIRTHHKEIPIETVT